MIRPSGMLGAFALAAWLGGNLDAPANGIYGNGIGAESMGLAGAEVAWSADPLSAMTANPAGLGFMARPEVELGAEGASLQGRFTKAGSGGPLDSAWHGLPEAGLDFPLPRLPITLGLSVAPQSALLAGWRYNDPPGGLGGNVSYGNQTDQSQILLLRSALGAAWRINDQWSVGATLGLLYNDNQLITPYVFQNLQPATVDGAKTLLNLHTTGFGSDATVGVLFRATTNLQFGASYQSPAVVNSSGDATGDPYAQFSPTPPGALAFHYDATVKNQFPQNASLGVSWRCLSRLRVAAQVDWIDWAQAFDTLRVGLSHGSSPGVNGVLGSSFNDNIPLQWSDELVYRLGLELALASCWDLRLGYCYGASPVPGATLTPMTAAITEHTFTTGLGWHRGRYHLDLAYQYDLPASQSVGRSGLLSGEYSNSSINLSAHILALSAGFIF